MFNIINEFDIREASFEEFVDFVFDHEVPPEFDRNGSRSSAWYHNAEVQCIPVDVLAHYTKLFTEPAFLFDRFSREQLEQGFWAIMGGPLDCSVGNVIWDSGVEFDQRAICVRSMSHLYEKFFAKNFLVTSGEMWWDALAYDWHCGNRNRANGSEDLLMQDSMFETLIKILALPSRNCQGAALHGLGHLHHPKTAEVINDYISSHPDLDLSMKEYAVAASQFNVL